VEMAAGGAVSRPADHLKPPAQARTGTSHLRRRRHDLAPDLGQAFGLPYPRHDDASSAGRPGGPTLWGSRMLHMPLTSGD
jgi:hypothetical protein